MVSLLQDCISRQLWVTVLPGGFVTRVSDYGLCLFNRVRSSLAWRRCGRSSSCEPLAQRDELLVFPVIQKFGFMHDCVSFVVKFQSHKVRFS